MLRPCRELVHVLQEKLARLGGMMQDEAKAEKSLPADGLPTCIMAAGIAKLRTPSRVGALMRRA